MDSGRNVEHTKGWQKEKQGIATRKRDSPAEVEIADSNLQAELKRVGRKSYYIKPNALKVRIARIAKANPATTQMIAKSISASPKLYMILKRVFAEAYSRNTEV